MVKQVSAHKTVPSDQMKVSERCTEPEKTEMRDFHSQLENSSVPHDQK